MRIGVLYLWRFLVFCVACLLVAPAIVHAQAAPYPVLTPGSWVPNAGNDPNLYPTAAKACEAQWKAYNPNAIFLGTGPVSPSYTGCRWDSSPVNANTIQPGGVWMSCATGGPDYNFTCTDNQDRRPFCNCGGTGPNALPQPVVGNPVALTYGDKVEEETDYVSADGLFGVVRKYNSHMRDPAFRLNPYEIAGFGGHWHGVIPGQLVVQNGASSGWTAVQSLPDNGDIRVFYFSAGTTPTSWTFISNAPLNHEKLSMVATSTHDFATFFDSDPAVLNGPGEVRLDFANGEYILYRRADVTSPNTRLLVPIEYDFPSGYKISYNYPDTGQWPSSVSDSLGRKMSLTWQAAPRTDDTYPVPGEPAFQVISSITLPNTTVLKYTYASATELNGFTRQDNLTGVQHLTASGQILWARNYLYENINFQYSLTGKLDQNGNRLSTYAYDASNRVTSTQLAGGVQHYTITNLWSGTTHIRQVINPLGHEDDYSFAYNPYKYWEAPVAFQSVVGLASAHVPAASTTFNYYGSSIEVGVQGWVDANGTATTLNPATGFTSIASVTEASGTASARTTNLNWHPTLDLITSETLPGRTISYTYSPTGQPLTKTITDTTTQSVPYATAGQTRTWTYSWTSTGRLASIHGPKPNDAAGHADLTSFTYDASGNLQTATNAIGQVTSFSGYDANGRPAQMTDPNGIVTAYGYDALGRVTSVTVKHPTTASLNATTSFSYDVEGRVTGIALPSTDTLTVDYNLAGQVLDIRAASGERINYINDGLGDVISETVVRTNGTTARSITRTFDEIGRMLTKTLGTGRTTSWAYDNLGQPTKITSARNNATQLAFDPLNRLVQQVAPDSGTTQLQYSVLDDLTQHTDPISVQTSFVRDGFGDVIQEVSPDRGTSTYYYDASGALVSSIDSRGQRVDYTRDILGRITKKVPTGRPTTETITYTWDAAGISGSYGKGRLASISDGSGTTKFKYDHRGNVLIKQQTIGTTTAANLTYAFDLADRITQITYPSGRIVGYVRDSKGRVTTVQTKLTSSATAWTLLASGITYEPFGSITGAAYGNGLSFAQSWGNDGRLASRRLYKSTGGTNLSLLTYGYDNDDNCPSS